MDNNKLDAKIAEEVFGLKVHRHSNGYWYTPDSYLYPFSTDINFAFNHVIMHFVNKGYNYQLHNKCGDGEKSCALLWTDDEDDGILHDATDESLPRAICLAALKVAKSKKPKKKGKK
jgi:hypothetical protein